MCYTQLMAKKADKPATSPQKMVKPNPLKDFALLMAIPAAIILIVALFTYIPRLLASPDYDFVYASCDTYSCSGNRYVVRNNTIESRQPNTENEYGYSSDRVLYYHDTSENSSREISLADAQQYSIDSNTRSPDGYKLERSNSSSGFFLLWYDEDNEWELVNGSQKKTVDLERSSRYYYDDVEFVGWVTAP